MKNTKKYIEYLLLGLIIIIAFLLRVVWQLDKVFVEGKVLFRGVDSWYHMRLVDNLMTNFPHLLRYDYFAQYSDGAPVGYLPLLSWLIYIPGQLFNYEVVAAWLPPILGVLTLIPIYLIGKEVFSSKVGILACLLVAILPGEFLHRTMLGFTDHHVLETLLMCTTLFFLIKAYKTGKWKWPVLAGISLGLYNLAWIGTSIFLLMIGTWFWIEFLRELWRREDTTTLRRMFIITPAIGLLLSYNLLNKETVVASISLILAALLIWPLTKLARVKRRCTFAVVASAPVMAIIYIITQGQGKALLALFSGGVSYIQEAMPLTLQAMFSTYGITFFVMLGGLVFALWERDRNKGLFLIWAVALGVIAVGQKRWGYYTVVPVSLLAAYFTFWLTKWVVPKTKESVVVIVVCFLVLTSLTNTIRLAQIPNTIENSWYEACTWLKENTPEPFPGGPTKAAYLVDGYEQNDPCFAYNAVQITGEAPEAQYGILSWWDYGHWIIRIGRRVPLTSPTHASDISSWFYTSTSPEEAEKVLEGLNIRYIFVDHTLVSGKWYAVQLRAGVQDVKLENTVLWKLWTTGLPGYNKVYDKGGIKIYERD